MAIHENKNLLDNVMIAAPCNVGWDNMNGSETVRFCGECKLNVYNISKLTTFEAETLINSSAYAEGKVCLRLYRRQDGTLITADCPKGLKRIRACSQKLVRFVAASFTALVTLMPAFAQKRANNENASKSQAGGPQCEVPNNRNPSKFSNESIMIVDGRSAYATDKYPAKTSGLADYTASDLYMKGRVEENAGNIDSAIASYKAALAAVKIQPNHDTLFEKTVQAAVKKLEKVQAKKKKNSTKEVQK